MNKITTLMTLLFAMLFTNVETSAQGIIVHKKDGTKITYKVSEIDSISTFVEKSDNPDITPGEAIDLGLPSGTKWASCNVGATSPEGYGGYYAWGETEEKSSYDLDNYKYCKNGSYINIGSNISGTQYDVARAKWGGSWRMPTKDEIKELVDKCTSTWITYNGVQGRKFTGPNGNSIFLPAAGCRFDDNCNSVGSWGYYWAGSLCDNSDFNAFELIFNSGYSSWDNGTARKYGQSVRAVQNELTEENVGEAIDLGLPSGTKWASCNVGASSSEKYGGYYAWGETEEKSSYDLDNYKYYKNGSFINIGYNISGTQYDVARAKWGGSWRMPTIDEIDELLDKCTSTWTTYNGVQGRKFTGPNGNSIFLPAAGYCSGDKCNYVGTFGECWSGSYSGLDITGEYRAWGLFSSEDKGNRLTSNRINGHSVRAVQ